MLAGAENLARRNCQDRAQALPSCENTVPHRLVNDRWIFRFRWEQTIEPMIDPRRLLLEIFCDVHDWFVYGFRRGLNHRLRFRLAAFLLIGSVNRLIL